MDMNYVEWVLMRGEALWRAREETLKKRLLQSVAAKNGEETEEEKRTAEKSGQEASLPQTEAVDGMAGEGGENALARLAQKLSEADDRELTVQEMADGRAAPVGMTACAAAPERGRDAENSGSAAAWLRQELGKDARSGALAAAAKEKGAFALAQEREVRETELFSLSLERDARRYDGGFLFY